VLTGPGDSSGSWLAAGRELLRAEPPFAAMIGSVRAALRGLPGSPDVDLDADTADPARVIFAVQLGLNAVLREWGLRPAAVTGDGDVASAAVEYITGRIPLAAACARVLAAVPRPTSVDLGGHRLPVHLGFAPPGGLGALTAGTSAVESLLSLLGTLYRRGLEIDWRRLYPHARIVSLPAYPFERRRHWLSDPASAGAPVEGTGLPAYVTGAVADTLGLDIALVTAEANFETLGMTSLDATELRRRLQADLGVPIPSATVWGFPTVQQLATHLHTLLDDGTEDEDLIRLGERLLS
jgi:acyl transferase domain-containing protein